MNMFNSFNKIYNEYISIHLIKHIMNMFNSFNKTYNEYVQSI